MRYDFETLELYGMLLLAAGLRPLPNEMHWFDLMAIDSGAIEYHNYINR